MQHGKKNKKNSVHSRNTWQTVLTISDKPILSGSPDYDTEEGGTLTLSPTIDANPSPTYIWWTRENHTSFIYYDVPLIIKNIKQIDSGSYIVYVMNTLTPSGMPETNLTSQKVYNINVTGKLNYDKLEAAIDRRYSYHINQVRINISR